MLSAQEASILMSVPSLCHTEYGPCLKHSLPFPPVVELAYTRRQMLVENETEGSRKEHTRHCHSRKLLFDGLSSLQGCENQRRQEGRNTHASSQMSMTGTNHRRERCAPETKVGNAWATTVETVLDGVRAGINLPCLAGYVPGRTAAICTPQIELYNY